MEFINASKTTINNPKVTPNAMLAPGNAVTPVRTVKARTIPQFVP